jgi:hypothetical protein
MPSTRTFAMSGFAWMSQKSFRQIGWPILLPHSMPVVATGTVFLALAAAGVLKADQPDRSGLAFVSAPEFRRGSTSAGL